MDGPGRHPGRCARRMALALLSSLAAVAPPPLRAQPASSGPDAGKRLFETVCVACHTVGAGVRIGPDLKAVTERRSVEWLREFIRNPERVRQAGDSVALANRAAFSIPMPALGLSEAQVDAVIAHLGATPAAAPVRPALYLPTLALAALATAVVTVTALTMATKRRETRA